MAIKCLEDIREGALFGKRLFQLGADINMSGPAAVAEGLYQNDECYKLVKPGGRVAKYKVNRDRDIATIARAVQRHFDFESAIDVTGNYMMAYSILFNCSMDYLYGKIEEKCPDVEILDISKKTGLSVEAIKRLMSNREVCMEEYLQAVYNYGLWDGPEVGTYDPKLEDYYVETYASVTHFWNELLESELFERFPENWYRMACALYTNKAVKIVADVAKQEWDELPPFEVFTSWVKTWECFHPDEPLYQRYDTWEEAYEKDPGYIKQVYKELRYAHLYSSVDRSEDYETAYWGCAGKFDRNTLDFFHQKAEEWCSNGQLPSIDMFK